MGRALWVIGMLAFGSAVLAQDAAQLQGYWISKVDGEAGAVVLRFADAAAAGSRISAGFRPARGGRWETVEGYATPQNRFELKRSDGGSISLQLDSGGRLNGKVTAGSGASYPVAFTHTILPDIHQWVAENPAPAARARKDSTIEVLYVAAADCGWCRRWEAKYLVQQKPRPSLGWDDVRFSMVDIGTFRAYFGAADAPAHLRSAMARTLDSDGASLVRGTPWFALFVNGELRSQAFGINAFETLIQPAIGAALREKSLDKTS